MTVTTSERPSLLDGVNANKYETLDIRIYVDRMETRVQIYTDGRFRGERRFWRNLDRILPELNRLVAKIVLAFLNYNANEGLVMPDAKRDLD